MYVLELLHHTYTSLLPYVCVCVCVCVRARARERERGGGNLYYHVIYEDHEHLV